MGLEWRRWAKPDAREGRMVFGLGVVSFNPGPKLPVMRSSPLFQSFKLNTAGDLNNRRLAEVGSADTICHAGISPWN